MISYEDEVPLPAGYIQNSDLDEQPRLGVYAEQKAAPHPHPKSAYEALNRQVGGDHYKKYKIEPFEYCYRNNLPGYVLLVLKYLLRFKDKGGAQDLDKAVHIIQMVKELEYGRSD